MQPETGGRRMELARFLRARRDELSPQRLGLPMRARRRTAGLRREEVAELAGISVGLYTWLEQGRNVPVSERTIDAVSVALELTEGERRHVHLLAQRTVPVIGEAVSANLARMVHAMHASPVLVLDFAWDIVVYNAAAFAVFAASPAAMTPEHVRDAGNVLDYLFLDPRARRLFVDWELAARSMLETFRFDLAPHVEEPRAQALVNRLYATSPDFARYWAQRRIRTHPDGLRSLHHPTMGALRFEALLTTPNEAPDFRLLIFAPADTVTAAKIGAIVPEFPCHAAFRSRVTAKSLGRPA